MSGEVDICVVGAGVAGCLAAGELARLGHRVALAHAPPPNDSPRIVESVSPAARAQLRSRLVVGGVMADASFSAQWGSERRAPAGASSITLVDVGKLHLGLLDWARAAGVRLASSRAFWRARRDGVWRIESDDGAAPRLRARFLVCATGRRGLLPSARTRDPHGTVALVGFWGPSRVDCTSATAHIRSFAEGWSWSAAWPDVGMTAMAFVAARNPRLRDQEERNLLLERAVSGLPARADARAPDRVSVCDARPFIENELVGEDWIKLGDSALSLDPLSGQGNQTAIRSALHSVAAVNTLLQDRGARLTVSKFLAERVGHSAALHRWLAGDLYAEALERWPDSPFFRERMRVLPVGWRVDPARPTAVPVSESATLKLSPLVRFVTTPCCIGSYIRDCEAVTHPALAQPLAFLDDIHVPALLRGIGPSAKVSDLLEHWSAREGMRRSLGLARWLIDRRIVMVT